MAAAVAATTRNALAQLPELSENNEYESFRGAVFTITAVDGGERRKLVEGRVGEQRIPLPTENSPFPSTPEIELPQKLNPEGMNVECHPLPICPAE